MNFLGLANSGIRNEGAQALSEVLKVNTILKSIDLDFNYIGEGISALMHALETNTVLQILSVEEIEEHEYIHNVDEIEEHEHSIMYHRWILLIRNKIIKVMSEGAIERACVAPHPHQSGKCNAHFSH